MVTILRFLRAGIFHGGVFLAVIAAAGATLGAGTPPDTLWGLQAWYDAGAITGVADGGAVSLWSDSSGNGANMAQAEADFQPSYVANRLNGLPAVYFDGGSFLSAGDYEMSSAGLTILGVVQSAGSGVIISKMAFSADHQERQWRLEFPYWDTQNNPEQWNANSGVHLQNGKYFNQWQVVGGTWEMLSTKGYCGGQMVGEALEPAYFMMDTPAPTLLGASSYGQGEFLLGYVSEVVAYNRALSEAEVAGIQEYFNQKYQLTMPVPRDPLSINVNFQPVGTPKVQGFLSDRGVTFQQQGNHKYGWSEDATGQAIQAQAAQLPPDRVFTDARYDSFIYMHNAEFEADWQIEVPNGYYYVRGIFGDPRMGQGTGIQNINMNRAEFTDATPVLGTTNTSDWDEHWGIVEVTDGRLKVGVGQILVGDDPVTGEPIFAPASGKICSVEIQEVTVPEVAVNFTNSTAWLESGFEYDYGDAYGLRDNGLTYGWAGADGTPVDNTAMARDRGVGTDQPGFRGGDTRLNTLNHMGDLKWEIAVENGWYSIMAVFGDPSSSWSADEVWIEDTLYHDVDYGMAYDLDLFLGDVEVTDGNLTIRGDEAAGGNAKIVYLQLTSIATPELPPILGDANDDGIVDDKDASILGAHWRQSGTTWADGDFNEDGYVNDMDAAILAAHWMEGSPAEGSVPEPSSIALLAILGCCLLVGRMVRGNRRSLMIRTVFTLVALFGVAMTAHAAGTAPDAVSGLQAWYKADAITGVADGSTINLWADSGPIGTNMTQANAANMPIWVADSGTGSPSVWFAGNDFMTAGDVEVHGLGGFTAIAMFQPKSTAGDLASKFAYSAGRQWRFGPAEFEVQETPGPWNGNNSTWGQPWQAAPLNYLEPIVLTGRWNPGVETSLYVNDQLAATAASPASTTSDTGSIFTLGADIGGAEGYTNAYVSEVAFYNRALTDTELAGIREYFGEKYSWTPYVPPEPTQPAVVAGFNFEPAATGTTLPTGWVTDSGGTYQTRGSLTYGWSKDMSHQTRAASAGQLPPVRDFTDGRFDTVIHTSDNGQPASWELDVPNGKYWVRGIFGEPRVGSIRGTLMTVFENTLFSDPTPSNNPVTNSEWVEHWGLIEVTDGKLTVSSGMIQIGENMATGEPIFAQMDSKLALLQVQSANVPDIAVNFQRASDMNLSGIYTDAGDAFGLRDNGLTYGWFDKDGVPTSNAGQARNRGTTLVPVGFEPGDPRFATLCHMYDMSWAIDVENGTYDFVAVFGEPQDGNWANDFVNIEGLEFNDPNIAHQPGFNLYMGTVEVTDGRFTIDPIFYDRTETLPFSGETTDNKIVYLELTRLGGAEVSAVPEPGTVALLVGLALSVLGLRVIRRK